MIAAVFGFIAFFECIVIFILCDQLRTEKEAVDKMTQWGLLLSEELRELRKNG